MDASFPFIGLPDGPGPQRVEFLHDVLAPALNLSFIPLADDFEVSARLVAMPDLSIVFGYNTRSNIARRDLSLTNGGFELIWADAPAAGSYGHVGKEAPIDGRAYFASRTEDQLVQCPEAMRSTLLQIGREVLVDLVPDPECRIMQSMGEENAPFVLLRDYVRTIQRQGMLPASLRPAISRHLVELAAAALLDDGTHTGIDAAPTNVRLALLQAWIRDRVRDPGLSIDGAARQHGVGVRYVQVLFQREGTTFTEFVLAERLKLARREIADTRPGAKPISDVAYRCGFSDLSYFNRAFKRRYGGSPREIRAQAQRQ